MKHAPRRHGTPGTQEGPESPREKGLVSEKGLGIRGATLRKQDAGSQKKAGPMPSNAYRTVASLHRRHPCRTARWGARFQT